MTLKKYFFSLSADLSFFLIDFVFEWMAPLFAFCQHVSVESADQHVLNELLLLFMTKVQLGD